MYLLLDKFVVVVGLTHQTFTLSVYSAKILWEMLV